MAAAVVFAVQKFCGLTGSSSTAESDSWTRRRAPDETRPKLHRRISIALVDATAPASVYSGTDRALLICVRVP